MPHVENWDPRLRRFYRVTLNALYLAIILGGLIGLTWPRAHVVPDELLCVLRFGGLLIAAPAAAALFAHVGQRWRLELLVVWWVNIGATIYISIVLILAGPERQWILFALFIFAAMMAVCLRGLSLLSFERRTREAKEGRRS